MVHRVTTTCVKSTCSIEAIISTSHNLASCSSNPHRCSTISSLSKRPHAERHVTFVSMSHASDNTNTTSALHAYIAMFLWCNTSPWVETVGTPPHKHPNFFMELSPSTSQTTPLSMRPSLICLLCSLTQLKFDLPISIAYCKMSGPTTYFFINMPWPKGLLGLAYSAIYFA